MLILTRRTDQSLAIGDDIEITVLGIKGNQARIAINISNEDVMLIDANIGASTKKIDIKKDRPMITLKKRKSPEPPLRHKM